MGNGSALNSDRFRGLLIGLLLGDALAYKGARASFTLMGSAAGQIACFTTEGMIRAHVRFAHRGVSGPQGVVWHAFRRWAHIQGLQTQGQTTVETPWPDGWLHQLAPLGQRRGDAPATAKALTADAKASQAKSAGHHALSNVAPIALFASTLTDLRETVIDVAALTHGDEAQIAAAEGVELLVRNIDAPSDSRFQAPVAFGSNSLQGTARHALVHGVAAAVAMPRASEFLDALQMANEAGGRGAATYAGALLGARHGISRLPQEVIARLELGIVGDTLARDAFRQIVEGPSGNGYGPAPDSGWWNRYPGW